MNEREQRSSAIGDLVEAVVDNGGKTLAAVERLGGAVEHLGNEVGQIRGKVDVLHAAHVAREQRIAEAKAAREQRAQVEIVARRAAAQVVRQQQADVTGQHRRAPAPDEGDKAAGDLGAIVRAARSPWVKTVLAYVGLGALIIAGVVGAFAQRAGCSVPHSEVAVDGGSLPLGLLGGDPAASTDEPTAVLVASADEVSTGDEERRKPKPSEPKPAPKPQPKPDPKPVPDPNRDAQVAPYAAPFHRWRECSGPFADPRRCPE